MNERTRCGTPLCPGPLTGRAVSSETWLYPMDPGKTIELGALVCRDAEGLAVAFDDASPDAVIEGRAVPSPSGAVEADVYVMRSAESGRVKRELVWMNDPEKVYQVAAALADSNPRFARMVQEIADGILRRDLTAAEFMLAALLADQKARSTRAQAAQGKPLIVEGPAT